MKKNYRKNGGSFIKATIVNGDVTNPPMVVINTKNAYEAIGLLCALFGEIVLAFSRQDKTLAAKMRDDILQTMNSIFAHIIDDLE